MGDLQFGGRLVLRDGSGAVDLFIDIDNEWVTLVQGDHELGRFPLKEVRFLRWDESRVSMSFAGEAADFYPFRPDDFVAALDDKQSP